jgi:flagellar hook assembly protein FlgD
VEPDGVVVEIVEVPETPGGLRVLGSRPNPLRGPGQIYFSLDEGRGQVKVQVFDIAGRLVRSFGAFEAVPGENRVRWDGTGDDGVPIGSGMYFVRIETDNHLHDTAKLLVVR